MSPSFKEWYPQFGPFLSRALHDNCSSEYEEYLHGVDPWANYHINLVVSCILDNFDESGKAQMAIASVLLGLLPTILGMVGSNTAEIGLLAMWRPFFTFMLSLGAPVLSPIRSFEYRSPVEMLQKKPGSKNAYVKWRRSICLVECIITLMAIFNVVHVIVEMCIRSVCVFSASTWWLPALWAGLSVIPHVLRVWSVRLRMHIEEPMFLTVALKNELTFHDNHRNPKSDDYRPEIKYRDKESIWYLIVSLLTSLFTILHIVGGTVIFSAALFISPIDAVIIAARLLASGIVCRILLMFELHVMKGFIKVKEE